jgi:hypothetical protein
MEFNCVLAGSYIGLIIWIISHAKEEEKLMSFWLHGHIDLHCADCRNNYTHFNISCLVVSVIYEKIISRC